MATEEKLMNPEAISTHASAAKLAICGIAGGVMAKFIEHPFDTIKVRLQATSVSGELTNFNSPLDCLLNTVRKEGPFALYKGLTSPLIGCMMESGISFFIYGAGITFLSQHFSINISQTSKQNSTNNNTNTISNEPSSAPISSFHPPLWVHFLCGGLAGVCTGFVLTPMELVKCKLQVQQNVKRKNGLYRGPIHCAQSIIKTNGFTGLWRGLPAAWGRDIPGNTLWFGASGSICELLTPEGQDTPISVKILAGSTGGVLYWAIPYPFDIIKSQLQVQKVQQTFYQTAQNIYKTNGIKGFYRGLSVCLLRTIPTSATLYTTATFINDMMNHD